MPHGFERDRERSVCVCLSIADFLQAMSKCSLLSVLTRLLQTLLPLFGQRVNSSLVWPLLPIYIYIGLGIRFTKGKLYLGRLSLHLLLERKETFTDNKEDHC
jgi:hypothetical protein